MGISDMVNLPTKQQFDEHNKLLKGIYDKLDTNARELEVASWDYVGQRVEDGTAPDLFNVGDCFLVNHDIFTPIYWRVLHHSSGDIYSDTYNGDIVVNTDTFTSTLSKSNNFELKYKRYSTSENYSYPIEGDITEVRIVETQRNICTYDSDSGIVTVVSKPPKNTLVELECLVGSAGNEFSARAVLFADGNTTTFSSAPLLFTVNDAQVHPTAVTSATFVLATYPASDLENFGYQYDPETHLVHIGGEGYSVPAGTKIEVDYRTTKPSMTLQTVNSLNTTLVQNYNKIQFDSDNDNTWKSSNVRQWLNTDKTKGNWFVKRASNDNAPVWAAEIDGFISGLDKSFLKYVGKCRKKTVIRNNLRSTYDNAKSMDLTEQFFLLSNYEVNAGTLDSVAEGCRYQYYYDFAQADLNAGRIKKVGTANKEWFLRSPNVGYASNVYFITTSGGLSNYNYDASNTYGVAPACVIV